MRQTVEIYLFVNPKSGSKKGGKLLEIEFKKVEMEIDNSTDVILHLVNLTIQEKKKKALRDLKDLQRAINYKNKKNVNSKMLSLSTAAQTTHSSASGTRRIILAVAGGDGTLMYIA